MGIGGGGIGLFKVLIGLFDECLFEMWVFEGVERVVHEVNVLILVRHEKRGK